MVCDVVGTCLFHTLLMWPVIHFFLDELGGFFVGYVKMAEVALGVVPENQVGLDRLMSTH